MFNSCLDPHPTPQMFVSSCCKSAPNHHAMTACSRVLQQVSLRIAFSTQHGNTWHAVRRLQRRGSLINNCGFALVPVGIKPGYQVQGWSLPCSLRQDPSPRASGIIADIGSSTSIRTDKLRRHPCHHVHVEICLYKCSRPDFNVASTKIRNNSNQASTPMPGKGCGSLYIYIYMLQLVALVTVGPACGLDLN